MFNVLSEEMHKHFVTVGLILKYGRRRCSNRIICHDAITHILWKGAIILTLVFKKYIIKLTRESLITINLHICSTFTLLLQGKVFGNVR